MAKQTSTGVTQVIFPSGVGQTNGKVIGPSAVAMPVAPAAPVLRPITPTKK